jgi:hypothetical protein
MGRASHGRCRNDVGTTTAIVASRSSNVDYSATSAVSRYASRIALTPQPQQRVCRSRARLPDEWALAKSGRAHFTRREKGQSRLVVLACHGKAPLGKGNAGVDVGHARRVDACPCLAEALASLVEVTLGEGGQRRAKEKERPVHFISWLSSPMGRSGTALQEDRQRDPERRPAGARR